MHLILRHALQISSRNLKFDSCAAMSVQLFAGASFPPNGSAVLHLWFCWAQSTLKMRTISPYQPSSVVWTPVFSWTNQGSFPLPSIFCYIFKSSVFRCLVSSKPKINQVTRGYSRLSPSAPFKSQSSWSTDGGQQISHMLMMLPSDLIKVNSLWAALQRHLNRTYPKWWKALPWEPFTPQSLPERTLP